VRVLTVFLIVSAGLALGADPVRRNPIRGDLARFQGAWALVSVEIEGRQLPIDGLKAAHLSIRGNNYTFQLDQTVWEFTVGVNESKKSIDLRIVKGPEEGKTYHGIYKLEGDFYTICRTTRPGKERPKAFTTQPESGLMMVVWRHVVRPPMEQKRP
jgi:uncharacterized protein (TIGR03067 family)